MTLYPNYITVDHDKQELRTRWRRIAVFELEELIVRNNLLDYSKNADTYQIRVGRAGKRSAWLMRSLHKETAVAIAKWLQYETGRDIRVSDKYF